MQIVNVIINLNLIQIIPEYYFKQVPIVVGFYLVTPCGNQYSKTGSAKYSYFGTDCVEGFVNEILTLEDEANKYFKINIPLKMTPRSKSTQSTICWLCEANFAECEEPFGSSFECD